MNKKILSVSLLTPTSLLALVFAFSAAAEEASVNTETQGSVRVMAPKPPLLTPKEALEKERVMRENASSTVNRPLLNQVRNIQQQKRTDIQNIRATSTAQINDLRAKLQMAQQQLKMGSTTPEGRAAMKDLRQSTVGEIKDIRQTQFADVEQRREEARFNILGALDDRRAKMASSTKKMASTTEARLEERKQNAIEKAAKLASKMVERLGSAVERLEKLSVRIQSRIDKIKAAGGTTDIALASIAEANLKIAAAKTGITEIGTAFATAATLPSPKDGAAAIQTATQTVNANIKAASDSLRKAVESLLGQKGADSATSVIITTSADQVNASTNAEVQTQ